MLRLCSEDQGNLRYALIAFVLPKQMTTASEHKFGDHTGSTMVHGMRYNVLFYF